MENLRRKNTEKRCECGKLCFVKTFKGYELKCPRCKRTYLLRYETLIVDYLTREKEEEVCFGMD